jgi:glycosyltransferase involved in cell wall biosynthesis
MRIALVGGFAFTPKGTMRARALPLGAELVRLGHEVTMFLPPYDNLADCGREWEQEGVRIRNVGWEQDRAVRGWARLPLYRHMLTQLIREVRRYRPDVIHVFKPKGFAGAAATYFLLQGGALVVLDCDDWEGWGGWNEIKRYPWIVKQYIDWQERWLIKRAHAVTVASRTLEERAANLRVHQSSVFYIPNCGASGDARKIQDAIRALPRENVRREFGFGDHPIVLYSGHFEDRENVDFFCRAAAPIAAKHGAIISFVGNDVPQSIIQPQFHAATGAHLRFFPQLPYREFLRLVWASDVAAFPYPDDPVHRAKCSARITDYMAMERAVLTSAVGQNLEYIIDGESGLLAAPDDEIDFAAKLDRLLSHTELRALLGSNARQRLWQKFQWSGDALQQCLAAYEYARTQRKAGTTSHAVAGASDSIPQRGKSAA